MSQARYLCYEMLRLFHIKLCFQDCKWKLLGLIDLSALLLLLSQTLQYRDQFDVAKQQSIIVVTEATISKIFLSHLL